jgi:hypothetical protein
MRLHRSATDAEGIPNAPVPGDRHRRGVPAAGVVRALIQEAAAEQAGRWVDLPVRSAGQQQAKHPRFGRAVIRRRHPAGPRRLPTACIRPRRSSSMSHVERPSADALRSRSARAFQVKLEAAVLGHGRRFSVPGAARMAASRKPLQGLLGRASRPDPYRRTGRRESPLLWGSPRSEKTIFEGKGRSPSITRRAKPSPKPRGARGRPTPTPGGKRDPSGPQPCQYTAFPTGRVAISWD